MIETKQKQTNKKLYRNKINKTQPLCRFRHLNRFQARVWYAKTIKRYSISSLFYVVVSWRPENVSSFFHESTVSWRMITQGEKPVYSLQLPNNNCGLHKVSTQRPQNHLRWGCVNPLTDKMRTLSMTWHLLLNSIFFHSCRTKLCSIR